MHSAESKKFLEQIMSHIKFPFDKGAIRSELEAHIHDKTEYYMGNGYDAYSAEQHAISDMGDAKEIGKELNKQHNPVIGWLWKLTNVLVVLVILWSLYFCGSVIIMTLFSANPINNIPKSNIVYSIDVNQTVQLDDSRIKFTKVIYEKNGNMNIAYEYYNKWLLGLGWGLGSIGNITDNLGHTYFEGSGSSTAGLIIRSVRTVENFNSSADTLIISYDNFNRKYRVEIPLKPEAKNE